jgi:hypothetical protein
MHYVETLTIGGTLILESTKYNTPEYNDVCFEFTEHATDHYSSDNQTSITIDAKMARKIIDVLAKHFEFKAENDQ